MSPGRLGSVVAGILFALGVTISARIAPFAVADERVSVNLAALVGNSALRIDALGPSRWV